MKGGMSRKKRVPPVMWRRYGNKASTLSHAISTLLLNNNNPHLVKPDDPPDYRYLLNHCFVVVSDNAPSPPPPPHHSRWPQSQIVWRTIEFLLSNQRRPNTHPNVLCYGYDKHNHSSPTITLLTSPTWTLLSQRVGDAVMSYLLTWTSIFLPLPRNRYHQVSGFPMSQLVFSYPKHKQEPQGSSKKRKRIDVDPILTRPNIESLCADAFSSSFICFGCAGQNYSTPSSWPHTEYPMKTSLHGGETEATVTYANDGGLSNGECPARASISMPSKRKHLKASRWQRKKKCRLLSSEEAYSVCPEVNSLSNKDNHGKRSRQYRWQRHKEHRLMSSQEACKLSRCAKLNTNDDLLTDHSKVLCSCCSVFQSMQKVSISQIDRQSMFYKLGSASGFPGKYILTSLKPTIYDANILFKDIFGVSDANINSQSNLCFHSNRSCITGSKCLYHSLLKHLKGLIRKAHLCQHGRLLEKHCSVPSFDQYSCEDNSSKVVGHPSMTNELAKVKAGAKLVEGWSAGKSICVDANSAKKDSRGTYVHFVPSKSYCTKEQVISFIWAVCRSIVPINLLGTCKAQRTLRKNISKLIKLRRFEKFSHKQGMQKLKASNFPILSNPHALCYFSRQMEGQMVKTEGFNTADDATYIVKQKILQSWVVWFFSSFVLPLVRANFYVTESQHGKQDIFYYQHSVWKKIVKRNIACLEDQRYELLNKALVLKIIWNRSFGFSKVRFLPKSTGVRPLPNLKESSRIGISSPLKKPVGKTFTSVNGVLHDLHAVLKAIQMKRPERLGYSVFDYNDVYRKLCSFFSVLKRGSGIIPALFVVVDDVSKAYESVNQDKWLSVMKDFFSSDKYLLEKFHRVVCTKKSLKFSEHIISGHQDMSTRLKTSMSNVLVLQTASLLIRSGDALDHMSNHIDYNSVVKPGIFENFNVCFHATWEYVEQAGNATKLEALLNWKTLPDYGPIVIVKIETNLGRGRGAPGGKYASFVFGTNLTDVVITGKNGTTTVIIANRLTTIRNADVIVVLKSGRVIESGSHDKLMQSNDSKGDTYLNMVQLQKSETQNKASTSSNYGIHGKTSNTPSPRTPVVNRLGRGQTPVDSLETILQERDAILDELHVQLLRAQQKMRDNADKKRREDQLEVGQRVYVKLQPYRQRSLARRPYEKLAAKYYGPFLIVQKIGQVAYRLQLPESSKIHSVFHITQLKRAIGPRPSSPTITDQLSSDFELVTEPETLIDV